MHKRGTKGIRSHRRSEPSGRKLTRHHVYPKARFGDGIIVEIPQYFHQCYHGVFGNLTPDEATLFMALLMKFFRQGGVLRHNFLEKMREEAKRQF